MCINIIYHSIHTPTPSPLLITIHSVFSAPPPPPVLICLVRPTHPHSPTRVTRKPHSTACQRDHASCKRMLHARACPLRRHTGKTRHCCVPDAVRTSGCCATKTRRIPDRSPASALASLASQGSEAIVTKLKGLRRLASKLTDRRIS